MLTNGEREDHNPSKRRKVQVSAEVKELKTHEEFEQTLKEAGNTLVVLDFTATWCPPCQKIKPHFKEMAKTYAGKAILCMVDVDEN
jgi:thiol-disulfide isomerase/thioredoxin